MNDEILKVMAESGSDHPVSTAESDFEKSIEKKSESEEKPKPKPYRRPKLPYGYVVGNTVTVEGIVFRIHRVDNKKREIVLRTK